MFNPTALLLTTLVAVGLLMYFGPESSPSSIRQFFEQAPKKQVGEQQRVEIGAANTTKESQPETSSSGLEAVTNRKSGSLTERESNTHSPQSISRTDPAVDDVLTRPRSHDSTRQPHSVNDSFRVSPSEDNVVNNRYSPSEVMEVSKDTADISKRLAKRFAE